MPRQPAKTKYTADSMYRMYEKLLPMQVIQRLIEGCARRYYRRLFPPFVVIWGFIYQRLNPDHTCDAALSYLRSPAGAEVSEAAGILGKRKSESTAGYCKARQRLPLQAAQGALRASAQALAAEFGEAEKWHGRKVCLLDGSTLRLPADDVLKVHYGLPKGKHGASHWPIMRVMVGFDLWSGAVESVEEGPYQKSEIALAIPLIQRMPAGSLFLGDRYFGMYHLLQVVAHQHQETLVRMKTDRVKRWIQPGMPSGTDLDVLWSPSKYDQLEPDLPAPAIPGRCLYVRIETPGFRPIDLYLFTTLTDRAQFPLADLVQLYALRWNVELDLRHVKTTLGMDTLSSKSVDMVRKELTLGLLAYNLIRGWMGLAALRSHLHPCLLSLASCWRRIMDTARSLPAYHASLDLTSLFDHLLDRLAACRLPTRKLPRHEPRGVWLKPQPYFTLKGSRSHARAVWIAKLMQS